MAKRVLYLVNQSVRQRAIEAVKEAPPGYSVTVSEPKRNLGSNAAMWVRLQAFSDQLLWPINGELTKIEPTDFKHILTAAYRQEVGRVALSLDGRGFVMLGARTSEMSQREMGEFLEFMDATAADRGVVYPEEKAA